MFPLRLHQNKVLIKTNLLAKFYLSNQFDRHATYNKWKLVVLIWTQAVKLYKNFVHFKYSLHVSKKHILGEYSSFFKPTTWNYLHLD